MCVVMVAHKTRPTEDMLEKGWNANPAGAGIAWRETKEGKGKKDSPIVTVEWRKGLELKDVIDLAATVPLPNIVHFRIPSVGGKSAQLCHPFPIEDSVSLALKGSTTGHVLFHNGHWGTWKDKTYDALVRKGMKMPSGKWSDTRAMALIASIYGIGVLDLIDEKAIAFGPSDIEISGSGWSWENEVLCSNTSWKYGHTTRHCGYFNTAPRSLPGGKDEEEDVKIEVKEDKKGPSEVDPMKLPFEEACRRFQNHEMTRRQWKNWKHLHQSD